MLDRNPHENRLLAHLDRQRTRPAPAPRRWPVLATSDARHLAVPRKPAEIHYAIEKPGKPATRRPTMPSVTVTSRAIKIVLVLDAAQVRAAIRPVQDVAARIPFSINVDGRRLTADFAPKAVRKCFAMIEEHGAEGCAVLIQGKLMPGDTIAEAGLVAQPKRKTEPAEVAA
jgi:hypothetical protein